MLNGELVGDTNNITQSTDGKPYIEAYLTTVSDKKLNIIGMDRKSNMPDESLLTIKAIDIATDNEIPLTLEKISEEHSICDVSALPSSAYKFVFEYDGNFVSKGYSHRFAYTEYGYVPDEFIYFNVIAPYIDNTASTDNAGAVIHTISGNGLNNIQNPVGKVFKLSDDGKYFEDTEIEFALPIAASSNSWNIPHLFFENRLLNGQYMILVMSGENIRARVDVTIDKTPFAVVGAPIISGNNVELKFNYDIDPDSVNADNLYVKLGENKVNATVTTVENTLKIALTPTLGTNEYILTVDKTVKSASGEELGEKSDFKFTLTGSNSAPNDNPSLSGGIRGGNNGGGISTGITAPPQASASVNFSDLSGYDWAKEAIYSLYQSGVIKGVSDSEFAPSANITRADYMLLIVRLLNLKADFSDNFADVILGKYYYEAIGIAKAMGLTDGVGENNFKPEESVTRQDMFVLAYRISQTLGAALAPSSESEITGFSDYSQISDYAKEAISALVKNGLVKGADNKLRPLDTAARAETAVFIERMKTILK